MPDEGPAVMVQVCTRKTETVCGWPRISKVSLLFSKEKYVVHCENPSMRLLTGIFLAPNQGEILVSTFMSTRCYNFLWLSGDSERQWSLVGAGSRK